MELPTLAISFLLVRVLLLLDVSNAADPSPTNQSEAVRCYSCTGIPPKYVKFNDASLMQYLKLKKLKIPVMTAACRENDIRDPRKVKDVPRYTCETGICVKLKGSFQGETFIVRDCWERLWDRPVDVDDELECTPLDAMADTMTDFCACSEDSCNGGSKLVASVIAILTPAVAVFSFWSSFIARA